METNAPQGFFGRLGGLLGPQGLTPEEQAQMGRQGLLQMGLGILANNHDRYNAGAAVGSGLLAGISAMQKSGKDLIDQRTGTTDPATFRAQHMAAVAAGYEPGSEGYRNFFKRANGELARASSAGYQPVKFKGGDGRERIGAFNGRTGNIDTPDGHSFKPGEVQITGFANPYEGAFQPPGVPPAGMYDTPNGRVNIGEGLTPEQWQLVQADVANGGASDAYSLPDRNVPTFTPAPVFQRPSATAGVNPFVGRRPEDEAAAIEQAKTNVKLGALPAELGMRTDAAIRQATEIERGKAGVEREADAVKMGRAYSVYKAAMEGVTSGLSGASTGPIVGRLPAVTANQQKADGGVAAILPILKNLFREAGEGTFTEGDQKLLTDMIPTRVDLPEARDWKLANIDRIVAEKLGQSGQGGGQQGAPVRIQSADDYNQLPSGAIYIAPDGMQRRKR